MSSSIVQGKVYTNDLILNTDHDVGDKNVCTKFHAEKDNSV